VRGDLTQSVASTGQVASNSDVPIKCLASGTVTKVPFNISDHVKAGDLLLQVDPTTEDIALEQAKSELAQSQSKLTEAKETADMARLDLQTATETAEANILSAQIKATNLRRAADREAQLLSQKQVAPQDEETAQTNAAAAQNALALALVAREELKSQAVALALKEEDVRLAAEAVHLNQIQVNNAQTQRDYCTVTAPIDGVVTDMETQLGGMMSSASVNAGGGTTAMTISDMSKIFVNASVDESDIGGVELGQPVEITADAFPDKVFTGKVVLIATLGINTSNVVTFNVKIEVTSPNRDLLKLLMTANVKILEATRKDVVMVPMMAVIHRGNQTLVSVVKPDNSTDDHPVRLGIHDLENQQIVSGIKEGDKVLVQKNESTSKWNPPRMGVIPGGRR
jgi:HlyD family secretion protein